MKAITCILFVLLSVHCLSCKKEDVYGYMAECSDGCRVVFLNNEGHSVTIYLEPEEKWRQSIGTIAPGVSELKITIRIPDDGQRGQVVRGVLKNGEPVGTINTGYKEDGFSYLLSTLEL